MNLKKHYLGDLDININSIANTLNVEDINENLSISELKKLNPDIIIVFGTRKLKNILLQYLMKLCGIYTWWKSSRI